MNSKSKLTRSLVTLAVTLSLGVAAFTVGVPTAEARGCRPHLHRHQHVQVYKVRTVEVCRHRHFEWRHNHCGHAYQAFYTVVTYKDFYSNGSWKSYDVTVWG